MIGLIGFGRFGRLMTRYLSEDFAVTVFDSGGKAEAIGDAGGTPGTLSQAAAGEIVLLSVPISAMPEMLERIGPMLRPGSLVMDVCSVKVIPDRWMAKRLPRTVSYLPTHPMFGPDSAAESLKDRKIVLCPGRVEEDRYACIRSYLQDKGLIVVETSPEEHDREIAVSLALTHFLGRSLSRFGAAPLAIDTEGYKRLLHILDVVEHDTFQLFVDMHRYNPFAGQVRERFKEAMAETEERLRKDR